MKLQVPSVCDCCLLRGRAHAAPQANDMQAPLQEAMLSGLTP